MAFANTADAAENDATGTAGIGELAEFIGRHANVLVLSGAGLSTGSGIPDYRDADGVRRGKAPILGSEFRGADAVRKRYWARSSVGWPVLAAAQPNAGHLAIARLQAAGKLGSILTQNVDGLHQRAGSRDVIELHGNIHAVKCLACDARFSRESIQRILELRNARPDLGPPSALAASAVIAPDGDAHVSEAIYDSFQIPACSHCDGVLMPDVVFFGDTIPRPRAEEAARHFDAADALLVVGSSLMVHSGYRFCTKAAERGLPIAAVNLGKTRADQLIGLRVQASAEWALPLVERLLQNA
jgi:NAD-dependent SIR2 family protein deacetylase